jgi:hypothetical protein
MRAHLSPVTGPVRAAVLSTLALCVFVACSATAGRSSDPEPALRADGGSAAGSSSSAAGAGAGGAPASGSAGAANDAGAGGALGNAGGSAGAVGIVGVTEQDLPALAAECGVIDLTTVHEATCPDAVRLGQIACDHGELYDQCSYFQFALDDPEEAREPKFVCQSQCVALEGSPFWSGWCTECARTCLPPIEDSVVVELDTSDCAQRASTPCSEGFETRQLNLDATLTNLLPRDSGAYSELRNNTALQVELEDGCPSRFYVSGGGNPLMRVTAVLQPALTGVRFECATDLSCGRIQGPDTLATQ